MDREDEREFERLKRDKRKSDKKGNLKEVSQICNYMGEILAKYGKWEEAKKEHEMELSLCEALYDTIGCAIACRKIGECFCGLEQYEKALNYQQRHLSLARSCKSLLEEQRALATIGRTYLIQSDTAKGNDALMKVSQKAEESFKKSLEVCENLRREVKPLEYMEMKARLYLNLGLVYDCQCKVTECAEYMKKAISIAQQHKLDSDLYRCQYSLASMYQRAGNLSQALRYLEAAQSSAVKLKDKYMESEALTQKAIIHLQLGDYSTCKHSLKKAHKLGSTTEDEAEKIKKCFKAASKIEEASESLESCPISPCDTRMSLFETLGDCAAEAGCYKQAIEYYQKMYECAVELCKPAGDLIPIYISLAQTYADNKQYKEAIDSYKKEIELRENDDQQICRTWLAIADLQEQAGDGYTAISQSYLTAFSHAKKAKHHKLQVYVLKSLTEVQKNYRKTDHLAQTQKKLESIRAKYDIGSDDELVDEDSQRIDDKIDEDEDDNCSISDLSQSESEDEAHVDGNAHSVTGRRKRTVQAKRNEKGETPLHRACIEGNLKKVNKLIQQGHPVNPRDYCGWIPLHEAANHGFRDIVEYLLDNGAAVNDRGGTHCMGVTPLIDAANCGNLDVMEVLISKGANVLAKDDEGNNALDCLQAWWGRCESITDEDTPQYHRLVEKLSSRKTGGRNVTLETPDMVFTQNSQSGHSQNYRDESDVQLPVLRGPGQQHSAKKSRVAANSQSQSQVHTDLNRTSRSLRRTLSSDSEDDSLNIMDNNDQDSENIYRNPNLERESLSTSATDSYKTAIRSVGQSANSREHSSQSTSLRSARKEKAEGAFIDEEEFVDDDWLIDDMRPSSKRRRVNVNGAFTSGNTCKNKTSTKLSKMDDENSDVAKAGRHFGQMDHNDFRSDDISDIMFGENSNDGETVVIEESDSPTSTQNNRLSLRSRPAKKRQLKLTNFGLQSSNTEDMPSITRQTPSSVAMGNRAPANQNFPSLTQNMSTLSSQSNLTNLMTSQTVAIPVTSLKVRVKDKLLVVPVFEIDMFETISWLANQASQRYYKLVGLRPILSLRTKDGAILTFDDPLSLVISSNEEIEGNVENWDLPPVTERYDQACKTLNIVGYRNIRTILGSSETSGVLDLGKLSLRASQFLPVFRAIQCQNSLKKLYLQDNRLSDAGMESLLTAFESLPNLAILDLSCNLISYVGIKTLANFLLQKQGQEGKTVAKNLTDLNLGHNSLGDGCCTDLSSVISCLPSLSMLNLASCDLTAKFLQQHRLIWEETIHKSSLTSLNISHNALGCLGMEHLLKSLVPERFLNLDLSYTMTVTSPTRVFVDHLRSFLTQEKSVLQKLKLNGCYLTTDDAHVIAKGIEEPSRLISLDLSCNPKLGNEALYQILAAAKNTELEEYVMESCGVISPLSSDLIDAIMEKLNDRCPLKNLCFTCVKLDKIDTESLQQVWRDHWGDLSVIKLTENSVKLTVCET